MKVTSTFTLNDNLINRIRAESRMKFEICLIDPEQPEHFQDLEDTLEMLLEWGKTYRITIEECNGLDS